MRGLRKSIMLLGAAALSMALTFGTPARADDPIPNDILNATLWAQRSVEFKGNSASIYALAKIRLDQALRNKNWTAIPAEQKGKYQNLPPAIILDVDETVLDNSPFEAWLVVNNKNYETATWDKFVKSKTSLAIPGSLDFLKYAASKKVKVFYVSNRDAGQKEATRANLEALGYPMGGNVDTVLNQGERKEWTSSKGSRRAFIAENYRVMLLFGDNMGDFTDDFRGNEAEHLKVYEANASHWGHDWLVVANPEYGSWESTAFGNNFKLSDGEKRKMKLDALQVWSGQ